MSKRLTMIMFIAGVGLGLAACHRTEPTVVAPKPQLSQSDKDFINQAEAVDVQERTVAKLIKEKSRNKELKKYADTMESVHSAALQKLAAVAKKYDMNVDPAASVAQSDTVNEFKYLSGNNLDVHFVDLVIQDHQKDVGLFQQEARWAKTNDLRDYANQTLPTLETHLKQAEQLQAQLDHPRKERTRRR